MPQHGDTGDIVLSLAPLACPEQDESCVSPQESPMAGMEPRALHPQMMFVMIKAFLPLSSHQGRKELQLCFMKTRWVSRFGTVQADLGKHTWSVQEQRGCQLLSNSFKTVQLIEAWWEEII